MRVRINGQWLEVAQGADLRDCLLAFGVEADRKGIAVAVGSEVVPRSAWATTTLSEGAELEVVTAKQGG